MEILALYSNLSLLYCTLKYFGVGAFATGRLGFHLLIVVVLYQTHDSHVLMNSFARSFVVFVLLHLLTSAIVIRVLVKPLKCLGVILILPHRVTWI
jgi:hypothetical protein